MALANNLRYIVVNVKEHDVLSESLGPRWTQQQEEQVQRHLDAYFEETWRPVVSILQQLISDAQAEARSRPRVRCAAVTGIHQHCCQLYAGPSLYTCLEVGERGLVAEHCLCLTTSMQVMLCKHAIVESPTSYEKHAPSQTLCRVRKTMSRTCASA